VQAGQAAASATAAAVGHVARVDAPEIRRPQPSPSPSPSTARVLPPSAPRSAASPPPGPGPTSPQFPRGRTDQESGRTRGVGPRRDRGGQRAQDRGHAAQTGVPTETRAGRRDLSVAAATATAAAARAFPVQLRRRDRGNGGVTGVGGTIGANDASAAAAQGVGRRRHVDRVVGLVQQRDQDDDDFGTDRRPTAAPGHDPKTRTQADACAGAVGRGRQTSLATDPVRVDARSAVSEPSSGRAAAVEQREPVERDDPQLVPARSHHPIGAEGHQSAGRRVLHVRVPVDAVLRAQPVAVRVP